ncbi:MAG: hypothetical protein RI936_28 [Pseudomonadota bacterium]
MTTRAIAADLVAARQDNARLQARVAELTRLVAGRDESDGPVPPLTLQQTMIVAAIARTGRMARVEMRAFLRRSGYDTGAVRYQIFEARQRLAPHGITIETLAGWGWSMDDASRARWRTLAAPPVALDRIRAGGTP